MFGRKEPQRNRYGGGKGLFWNETFRRCITVVVTVAMVTQNLTLGGAVSPSLALEPAGGTAEERFTDGNAQPADQNANDRLTSLVVRSRLTDSEVVASEEANVLSMDLGYKDLEPNAEYEAVVELLDAATGDVLVGEPWTDDQGETHSDSLEFHKNVTTGEATDTLSMELEDVDVHWVAGRVIDVRVTLLRGEDQVAQRTFDAEEDGHLYAPAIESALHAADNGQELAATEEAAVTDSITVTGLPEGLEAQVTGALETTDGDPVAAGVATITASADGTATADLSYPAFDARGLAGKELASKVSVLVKDRVVASYPAPEGRRREGHSDRRTVTVATAAEPQGAEGEQGEKQGGEESGSEDSDDADGDSDTSGSEAADGQEPADSESAKEQDPENNDGSKSDDASEGEDGSADKDSSASGDGSADKDKAADKDGSASGDGSDSSDESATKDNAPAADAPTATDASATNSADKTDEDSSASVS
ncbi:MAG: hypothetical protein U0J70_04170, partial [Atopobiaceae bacterium]|nr:hypothetical protein [Atopobiaceae bacterium]